MKAGWDDIEIVLNANTLEDQDRATLEAFLRVEPPPSKNPAFHARFNDAKERIRHRLREMRGDVTAVDTIRGVRDKEDTGRWYVDVIGRIREMRRKVVDAQKTGGKKALEAIKGYLGTEHDGLTEIWPSRVACPALSDLGRHISFFEKVDLRDMLESDLPAIEEAASKHFLASRDSMPALGFEELLHPVIRRSSYTQFRSGHLRDAVLNSVVGLCDHIRNVSGSKLDGAKLMNEVFAGDPILVLSELESESGRNDQTGFHKIFLGAFEGIRNAKAHSLSHDLTPVKAAQYLVFASLLARRVDESKKGNVVKRAPAVDEAARGAVIAKRDLGARVAEVQELATRAMARTERRGLTAGQREAFVKAMADFRGQRVSVYHDERDAEAEGYAAVLSSALRDAGVGQGEYTAIEYDPRPEGVVVYCNNPKNPFPLPVGLRRALRTSGASAELSEMPGWAVGGDPNWTGLWVGILPRD